jgi:hypothetical protein
MFKITIEVDEGRFREMVNEALTAKIQEVKEAIAAEAQQVKDAIDSLKAQIESGLSVPDILAELDSLKGGVDAIYQPVEAVPTPDEVPPSEPAIEVPVVVTEGEQL